MKKIIAIVLALVLVCAIGFVVYRVPLSPEFMLNRMSHAIQREGADGIRPFLTEKLQSAYDKLAAIVSSPVSAWALEQAGVDVSLLTLQENASALEWSLKGVERSGRTAQATLGVSGAGFNGVITLNLVMEGFSWKINDFSIPIWDNISANT